MHSPCQSATLILFQDLGLQRIAQAQLLQQAFRLTLAEAPLKRVYGLAKQTSHYQDRGNQYQ